MGIVQEIKIWQYYLKKRASVIKDETYKIAWDFVVERHHVNPARYPDVVLVNIISQEFTNKHSLKIPDNLSNNNLSTNLFHPIIQL